MISNRYKNNTLMIFCDTSQNVFLEFVPFFRLHRPDSILINSGTNEIIILIVVIRD